MEAASFGFEQAAKDKIAKHRRIRMSGHCNRTAGPINEQGRCAGLPRPQSVRLALHLPVLKSNQW